MSGFYTDLNEAQWAILAPLLPPAKPGGRPRTMSLRSVLDAVFTCYARAASGVCCPIASHHGALCIITFDFGSEQACGCACTGPLTRWPVRRRGDRPARRW